MSIRFYIDSCRKDATNLAFLKHRKFDGFIVTMHQSGTHWLKHMLACAIAKEKGLPPPKDAFAGDMIGGNKDPVKFEGVPLFGHSHTIPSFLITSTLLDKIIKRPRYVILVRDIRSMLISHYEKFRNYYKCDFSDYLRGNEDIVHKRFASDIWWCIRFQNAWGRMIEKFPDQCLLLKYENIMADPLSGIKNINSFLGLNLSDEALIYGVQESTKDKMKAKPLKPQRKMKKKHNREVVRTGTKPREYYFDSDNLKYFKETCKKFLKYDFGYDYQN